MVEIVQKNCPHAFVELDQKKVQIAMDSLDRATFDILVKYAFYIVL